MAETQAEEREETGDTFDMARVSWVLERNDLLLLADRIAQAPCVVYDLETTGLIEHATTGGQANGGVAARIVLVSYTLPTYDEFGVVEGEPDTYLVPLSHPDSPHLGNWVEVMTTLAEAMVQSASVLVGHNVKFDHRWTYAQTGVDLSHQPLWDTRISSHLIDETVSTRLKERAPDTFRIQRWDDDVTLNYPGAAEEQELFTLGAYAARDTYWTWKLYENHRERMLPQFPEELVGEEIEEAKLGDLASMVSMPTTATLTSIEQRGFKLDREWVEATIEELQGIKNEAWVDLAHRYPDLDPDKASFAATSNWFREWAEKAVDNGDLRVASLTPTGLPQWSKQVLSRQARGGSEVAEKLLAVRNATKRLEYLRSWMKQVTTASRIHTTYNAGSVVTGRLSSQSPNMQQVTYSLRPAFVPSETYVLADLDYSQIELRVAAFLSRSEPMLRAFRNGDDLHATLAGRISGKRPEDVTPAERQAGKSANFGLLYGMGVSGFQVYAEDAYGVHFSDQEAHQVHEAFFSTWNGIRRWHARQMDRVHRDGQVVSPIGRVRRLQDIWSSNTKHVAHAERNSINAPVQGFASDIMQIAAACIEGNIPGIDPVREARIVGTVHDSIVVEVPRGNWEEIAGQCQHRMENEVPDVLERLGCLFDVPLKADATVGTRWGLSDVGEL